MSFRFHRSSPSTTTTPTDGYQGSSHKEDSQRGRVGCNNDRKYKYVHLLLTILTPGALLTPSTGTRLSMVPGSLFSSAELYKSNWNKLPPWAIVLLQIMVTLPLYIFSFWLMLEGIKAGGQNLVMWIDYMAFRRPPK